jgi:DNA-binding response OmpR family regulator
LAYRIAVIDDDPDILTMLEAILSSEGHRVLCYTVGDGAYEWIRSEQPDLIILDLWMETPDTGNAVLGLLQKDAATRSIPIIVFSGYLQTWHLEAVLPLERRVATLAKPASFDQILGLVTALLPAQPAAPRAVMRVNTVNDSPP